ncbi:ribonuclease III domain-containing protein [Nonomuraea sp. NPDC050680]|uniref:ribonuclease III domain-containing protein n=1 Tax=Nonomuraea sp. NPDC050680 TaxID=3154630 RepID=UPI0033DA34CE
MALPIADLASKLGVSVSPDRLIEALTHGSYAYERGGRSNRRLAFLGKGFIELVVTEELGRRHPRAAANDRQRMKSFVVNERAVASVARSLGLDAYLRLGRGEDRMGGRRKPLILANALEAVVGAVHADALPCRNSQLGKGSARRSMRFPLVSRKGS